MSVGKELLLGFKQAKLHHAWSPPWQGCCLGSAGQVYSGNASCAADHTAQVSLVSILPRTCMVQGLHSGTNQPCYELDWDKG